MLRNGQRQVGATDDLSASASLKHGQQAARGTPGPYAITEFACQNSLEARDTTICLSCWRTGLCIPSSGGLSFVTVSASPFSFSPLGQLRSLLACFSCSHADNLGFFPTVVSKSFVRKTPPFLHSLYIRHFGVYKVQLRFFLSPLLK